MAKFADQLFTDLMAEYRPTLEQTELPEPPRKRPVSKPVWLTSGATALAALVTTVVLLLTTGGPAYAVTRNPDGTVTLTLNQMTALTDAAAALHSFGAPDAVGCQWTTTISGFPPASTNTVVINPKAIPPGRTGVLVAKPNSSGMPLVTWVVLPSNAQDCAAISKALKNVHAAQLGHPPTMITNAHLVPVPSKGGH
jgi:hypothetical protein